jgi:acid phosphatase family membrane protein YuiD
VCCVRPAVTCSKNQSAVGAWAGAACCAQVAKVLLLRLSAQKWDWAVLVQSGGMPSSHSALVCGCVAAVGGRSGCSGDAFALSAILSLVVMYDAAGVRLEAGRHAKVLNRLLTQRQSTISASYVS